MEKDEFIRFLENKGINAKLEDGVVMILYDGGTLSPSEVYRKFNLAKKFAEENEYRDYEMEMDARDFARNLMVTLTQDELPVNDAEFDEEVLDNLTIDQFSDVRGLIALFYRNLWAMADLREKLKDYEDAEEQGLILRLPISEDTPVYSIEYCCGNNKSNRSGMCFRGFCENCSDKAYYIRESVAKHCSICEINKSVFFTHEEAEAKLKEMRGAK